MKNGCILERVINRMLKTVLSHIFDLIVIISFMLIGMVIADFNGVLIWVGALAGLVIHKLMVMFFTFVRNYIFSP